MCKKRRSRICDRTATASRNGQL